MGLQVEGLSVHNAAEVYVRKAIGRDGRFRWIEIVVQGHDGKKLEIATIFDTDKITILEDGQPFPA